MVDFYQFNTFKSFKGCVHAVTTKRTDESYELSVALHTGEVPLYIKENRKKITLSLGWKDKMDFIVANQTHGDNVEVISKNLSRGWNSVEDAILDCDALITNKKNLILCILTADCVPIILYDKKKDIIAAVHAGWKGTQLNIVEKTIQKMSDTFGSEPFNIIAGIGPSIGECCYEVGEDVAQYFYAYSANYKKKGDKFMLNLPSIINQQLLSVGLLEEHIEKSNICTSCNVERFFSYRKENGCSGRFMSMIGLV